MAAVAGATPLATLSPSASTAPTSTAPPAPPIVTIAPPPVPNGCQGSEFWLWTISHKCFDWSLSVPASEALRNAADSVHGLVQASIWSLQADLRTESAHVRSGEKLETQLVLTNTTQRPVLVDIPEHMCLDVNAYAHGTRQDFVFEDCRFGSLCSKLPYRVVLDPGGAIYANVPFVAWVTRATPATHCDKVVAGGLPPGNYELRVMVSAACVGAPSGPLAIAPVEVD